MVERLPRVSIIIPTRNGSKTIGRCLSSITTLDYPDVEVLVINDGSTDDTSLIVEEYAKKIRSMRIMTTSGIGPSAARNMGIANTAGEFLAFTDDDCIVDRGWLRALLHGFENDVDGRIAGVGGDQLSPDDECAFGATVNGFLKTIGFVADYVKSDGYSDIRGTGHNPTCNAMYRRGIMVQCGGFREGLWPGEDVEFDRRLALAGYSLRYNPKAVVYHYRPESMGKFFRMMYRYGNVQAFLVRQYGFFRRIQYEPLALAVYLAVLVMSLMRPAWFVALLCAPLLLLFIFFIAKTRDIARACRFVPLFVVTIFGWNMGFAAGIGGKGK